MENLWKDRWGLDFFSKKIFQNIRSGCSLGAYIVLLGVGTNRYIPFLMLGIAHKAFKPFCGVVIRLV